MHAWSKIKKGEMTIKEAMAAYAGITDLSKKEEKLIASNKEMGISDVLSARQNVIWGWSGTDEADHTSTPLPVFAYGPFSDQFEGTFDNTDVCQWLFIAVSGYWH